jgi:hypothetical protein
MKKLRETMRRGMVLVAMMMLAASTLCAQTAAAAANDGAEIAVTYAGQRSIVTGPGNGFWLQGVAADASQPVYRGLALAGDFTFGHSGNTGGAGSALDVVTIVAGPRFTWKMPAHKLRPALFGEALFGVAHGFNSIFPEGASTPSSASSFALMTGGGVDLPVSRWAGIRLLQVDYVRSTLPNGGANVQNSFRIAAGVNFTLPGIHHSK